ncbi:MAG: YbhN family protein [Ilumatobacteraceae bacterium]
MRWIARKLHTDEDRAARVIRRIASRLEEVLKNPGLMGRVAGWAAVNWLLGAASLWVFLRAFGGTLDPISLLVAFGLGNIVAVIPITPGGLGIVDGVYLPTLVGFGLTRSTASLGFASYRIAQFFLPVLVGGILYLSLRVGPFRIERREERLASLRELARDDDITRGAGRLGAAQPRGRAPPPRRSRPRQRLGRRRSAAVTSRPMTAHRWWLRP